VVDQVLRRERQRTSRIVALNRQERAERLLKRRLGEVSSGRRLIGPDLERTTFEDLERLILEDYRLNERKSSDSVRQSFRALRGRFAGWRARDISYDELISYATARGAKPATVKRELALLHRAFILAVRAGKAECPTFPTIRVRNARSGFFEPEQWEAVRSRLPEHIDDTGEFGYITGWRVMEILTLPWRQIDSDSVRLPGSTTKNGLGRVFPFKGFPQLEALIVRRREGTDAVQRKCGRIIPWVFHDGKGNPFFGADRRPKRSFRRAWRIACESSGVPGRFFHDFRRTAVRNLERAGVPRAVAMALVGHKTESVYRRYDIVAESDLAQGVKKLGAFLRMGTTSGTTGPSRSGNDSI